MNDSQVSRALMIGVALGLVVGFCVGALAVWFGFMVPVS